MKESYKKRKDLVDRDDEIQAINNFTFLLVFYKISILKRAQKTDKELFNKVKTDTIKQLDKLFGHMMTYKEDSERKLL